MKDTVERKIKRRETVHPTAFTVTATEKQLIKDAAKKRGVSFSDFVRQAAVIMASE